MVFLNIIFSVDTVQSIKYIACIQFRRKKLERRMRKFDEVIWLCKTLQLQHGTGSLVFLCKKIAHRMNKIENYSLDVVWDYITYTCFCKIKQKQEEKNDLLPMVPK